MMNYFDWIEDYINDELTADQMESFEAQLLIDKNLADQLQAFKDVKTKLDLLRLRTKVRNLGLKEKGRKHTNQVNLLAIAASLFLFIAMLIIFKIYFSNSPIPDSGQLVEHSNNSGQKGDSMNSAITTITDTESTVANEHKKGNAKPKLGSAKLAMINFSFVRDLEIDTVSNSNDFKRIQNLFELGDYKKARQVLLSINSDHYQEERLFMQAYCSFKLAEYKTAKSLFYKLKGNPQYGYEAEWNYLLTLILLNDKEGSTAAIQQILYDPDHPYYRECLNLKQQVQ